MKKRRMKAVVASATVVSIFGLLQGAGIAQADSATATQTTTTDQSVKPVHVTVRVEGYGNLHFARQITVGTGTYQESDGSQLKLNQPTVLGALLTALDSNKHTYVLKPNQWGPYLTAIDNEKEKDLHDTDSGWSFWLNGEPLQVGADQQTIKDGDTIVCGFYDYSKTLYPTLTLSTNSVTKGLPVTITLSAEQTTYDSNWNPITNEVKVKDAVVHFGNQTVTTDAYGQAEYTPSTNGNIPVYADEYDKDGLPLLIPTAVQTLHVHDSTKVTFMDQDQVSWASQAIRVLAAKSVIWGEGDGYFKPGQTITRAELGAMTVVATQATASGSAGLFGDVDTHAWYAPFLQIATANGLLQGDPNHMMRPNSPITREELATVLVHAAGLDQEVQSANSVDLVNDFHDADSIDGWAKGYVAVAVSQHLLNGMDGNLFAPKNYATRAEAAVAIANVLQNKSE